MSASHDPWEQLRRGNADALHELYKEHYVGLVNYGMRLTRDHALIKDCITQMLLNLHRQHSKLPPVNNVRSYLLTCLRNEILLQVKQDAKRNTFEHSLNSDELVESSYEENLVSRQIYEDNKERIHRALLCLSDRERELLKLRFFENFNYEEIADSCGITKRTAYNIINNALKRLKMELLGQPGSRLIYISLVNALAAGFL